MSCLPSSSPMTQHRDPVNLEMDSEATIVQTWRPKSSHFGDVLGGRDCAKLEIHLEAVIEWVWRCTWRPLLYELGGHRHASIKICTWRPWMCELGGCDRVSLEMHLDVVIERLWRYAHWGHESANMEAVIDRVWGCSWWPWSSEIAGVLGGGQSGGSSFGGRRDASRDCIFWLTCDCGNVVNWVQHGVAREKRLAESGRQSILN